MTDPDEKQRMAQLEDKIASAKAVQRPQSQIEDHHSQAHAGWRMVTELVAGLLIGFSSDTGWTVCSGHSRFFWCCLYCWGLLAE